MCGGGSPDPILETDAARESMMISVEKYNYGRELNPLKDKHQANIESRQTEGAEGFVRGKANLKVQEKYGMAIDGAQENLRNSGVDPSSGRSVETVSDAHDGMGEVGGTAGFNAAYENESQALAGKQNIIGMSMGQAGKAQQGMSEIASASVDDAIGEAFSDFNEQAAENQATGMAAGIVASGAQYAYSTGDT